jgi:hypothetical protein
MCVQSSPQRARIKKWEWPYWTESVYEGWTEGLWLRRNGDGWSACWQCGKEEKRALGLALARSDCSHNHLGHHKYQGATRDHHFFAQPACLDRVWGFARCSAHTHSNVEDAARIRRGKHEGKTGEVRGNELIGTKERQNNDNRSRERVLFNTTDPQNAIKSWAKRQPFLGIELVQDTGKHFVRDISTKYTTN